MTYPVRYEIRDIDDGQRETRYKIFKALPDARSFFRAVGGYMFFDEEIDLESGKTVMIDDAALYQTASDDARSAQRMVEEGDAVLLEKGEKFEL